MVWYIVAIGILVIFNILFIRYAWRTFMKDWEKACHEVFAEARTSMREITEAYMEAGNKAAVDYMKLRKDKL